MNNQPMTNDPMTNDQITGEFTDYCNRYYELTQLLAERDKRLTNLLDNAPVYSGQTRLSDIDAIISYYRNVQAAKGKVDKTLDDMRQIERFILMIMRYFEITPRTVLTGQIPGELEYKLSADENDTLTITKTKNLQPEEDNPNIIVIKFWDGDGGKE